MVNSSVYSETSGCLWLQNKTKSLPLHHRADSWYEAVCANMLCFVLLFFLLRCSLLGSLWVVLTHRPGLKAAKMSAFIEVLALPDDQFFKSILAAPDWYTCSLDYLYVICFPLPYTESCEYFYK